MMRATIIPIRPRVSRETEHLNAEAARLLRVLRRRAGLTQRQLAARLGVRRQTISERENGVGLGAVEQWIALEIEAGERQRRRAA